MLCTYALFFNIFLSLLVCNCLENNYSSENKNKLECSGNKHKIPAPPVGCTADCGEFGHGYCNNMTGECDCQGLWFGSSCNISPVYYKQNLSSDQLDYYRSITNSLEIFMDSIELVDGANSVLEKYPIGKNFSFGFYNQTSIKGIRNYVLSNYIYYIYFVSIEVTYLYSENYTLVQSGINPDQYIPIDKSAIKLLVRLYDFPFTSPNYKLQVHFTLDNNIAPSLFSTNNKVNLDNNSGPSYDNNNLFIQYTNGGQSYGPLLQFTSYNYNSTIYNTVLHNTTIKNNSIDFTIQIGKQLFDIAQFEIYISFLYNNPSPYHNITPGPCEYTECDYPTPKPNATNQPHRPDFIIGNSNQIQIPITLIILTLILVILNI